MSSLHANIMNIPHGDKLLGCQNSYEEFQYKEGHRDARHAAAELAIAADKRTEELESALKAAKQYVIQTDDYGRSY